jgi:hypothetical protein
VATISLRFVSTTSTLPPTIAATSRHEFAAYGLVSREELSLRSPPANVRRVRCPVNLKEFARVPAECRVITKGQAELAFDSFAIAVVLTALYIFHGQHFLAGFARQRGPAFSLPGTGFQSI